MVLDHTEYLFQRPNRNKRVLICLMIVTVVNLQPESPQENIA